jgi:LPXTG-site transpeptidase (sortase) family protein
MPRTKKILTPQSQWTLILIGGLCFICVGFNWQKLVAPKVALNPYVSAVLTQAGSDYLTIPTLSISAPIIYSTETKESSIQQALASGVVHLAQTATPGEVGNAYIVGHSSNYKDASGNFNEIFKNLPHIRTGDVVSIVRGGDQFEYVVTQTKIVEPTELWVMSQATEGQKILTLQTSYPIGSAKQRFIVRAKLSE